MWITTEGASALEVIPVVVLRCSFRPSLSYLEVCCYIAVSVVTIAVSSTRDASNVQSNYIRLRLAIGLVIEELKTWPKYLNESLYYCSLLSSYML